MSTAAAALLDTGLIALPEAVASVDDVVRGRERVLVLRFAGGLQLDVLPDRGLDIGATWWAGVPVAWRSPHRVDPGPGHGWEQRFLGGLLVTCGPDNIGPARDGLDQHGSHHRTPATEVRWWRERVGDELEIHVSGLVGCSTLYGLRLVVEREIVVGTGRARVEVRDTVRNDGYSAVPVPLLYHVNLGAPLLAPGSRLVVDADRTRLREPTDRDPLVMPPPGPGLDAVVAEHSPVRSGARLVGTAGDVVVDWTDDTLPRLCTWAWPAAGAWVLGVEPANAPQFGTERDEPGAGAPVLQPGASWRTGVTIEIIPRSQP